VPVLEDAAARAALSDRLREVDRLVLLGDTVELRRGSLRQALAAALPVLSELGTALGADGEVVIVPGNHDHRLLGPWRERRAATDGQPSLGLQTNVEWSAGEPLEILAGALHPARVSASYPGLWLRDDVYAIHGHYLDLHITVPIMERLGAGLMRRLLRAPDPGAPEEYESVLGPMYAWVDSVAEAGAGTGLGLQGRVWSRLQGPPRRRNLRQHATAALVPAAVLAMNRLGLGPLRADLSGPELRRAGLAAFAEVLQRLDVATDHVIFGHTHRAGPLPGDEPAEWSAGAGAAMLNCGSWVYAASFLGRSPRESPYRPGFGYLVGQEGPPELVNLLDGRDWRPGHPRAPA
jgi:predicted phosphodiesterase